MTDNTGREGEMGMGGRREGATINAILGCMAVRTLIRIRQKSARCIMYTICVDGGC